MFYNGEPLYKAVHKFIEEHTGMTIDNDEDTLESLGIDNDDVDEFQQDVCDHFDLETIGDGIGDYACVFNVTNFVEENL